MSERLVRTAAAMTVALLVAAGPGAIGRAAAASPSKTIKVTLTDDGCPAKLTLKAGRVTFKVTNDGADSVSEFEILRGHKVLAEKENLAPGLSGSFTVTLPAGRYTTYCPGGDREKGKLVVTGAAGKRKAADAAATVDAELGDYKITASPLSVPAGNVRFKVKNAGKIVHEFVVVRGSAATVTTEPDGSVGEDGFAEADKFGELEDLKHNDTATLTAKRLTPGTYLLFCNVVDKSNGSVVSHFAHGMHTQLTVQ